MSTRRHLLAAALAGLACAAASSPAHATYPGSDGRLAFGLRDAAGNVDVHSARPNGNRPRRLTSAPGFDACPAYSPDGRSLAFCSDRSGAFEIWAMRPNGRRQRQVTHLGGRLLFPDYSPDGRRLVMSGTGPGEPEDTDDLWVSRADGRCLRRLTNSPGAADLFPAYSPDGRSIAFLSDRGGPAGVLQLWLVDADGRNPRRLTSDATAKDQLPDWSPDGRKIAYSADDDIWVMNADGTGQVNLTGSDEVEFGPAWSPTGTRIAFLRETPLGRLLHTMAADGTGARVVHPEGPALVPAWQPRG